MSNSLYALYLNAYTAAMSSEPIVPNDAAPEAAVAQALGVADALAPVAFEISRNDSKINEYRDGIFGVWFNAEARAVNSLRRPRTMSGFVAELNRLMGIVVPPAN